jgi:hypothetical protein
VKGNFKYDVFLQYVGVAGQDFIRRDGKDLDLLMVFLDGIHRHSSFQGFDPIDHGFCTEESGDTGNVMDDGFTPYGHFIRLGFFPTWGIDDQVDLSILNSIHDIRPSFPDLEDGLDRNPVVD